MDVPFFLDVEAILALYDDVRIDFGVGLTSIDEAKIAGALGRVQDNYYYREPPPSIPELGGLLGYSVAKAHAFGDGNKRTSLTSMDLFLEQNGWINAADGVETAKAVEAVVANEMTEADFIDWIAERCVPADVYYEIMAGE